MKLSFVFIIMLILALVFASGCTSSNMGSGPTSTPQDGTCQITDYHNGVVYFGCSENDYANALSDYIGKNNVTATSASVVTNYSQMNYIVGYIVTFKPNEVCK